MGLLNVLGNKGAAGVRMRISLAQRGISSHERTSAVTSCFISSHLVAHRGGKHICARNENYHDYSNDSASDLDRLLGRMGPSFMMCVSGWAI